MSDEKKTGIVQGHLIDLKIPGKDEKGPVTVFVGGVKLSFWKTTKNEDDDWVAHPLLKAFRDADEEKAAVKVKYESSDREFKGRTYTDNTPVKITTEGVDDDEVAKGDKASEEAKAKAAQRSGGKGSWQPRDEAPVASRWAVSTALELQGEGIDITKAATAKAVEKAACTLLDIAHAAEKHARDLAGKAAKPAGPVNKAADAEPEKKEVPADSF